MLTLDGTLAHGGSHLVRATLALSLLTGKAFKLLRIRMDRKQPGLMRSDLYVIRAAQEISNAEVEGAAVGSQELIFRPGSVRASDYTFRMGLSESAFLMLETLLPALLQTQKPMELALEGGTHIPDRLSFEPWQNTLLPLLEQTGFRPEMRLERHGFAPAGAGRVVMNLQAPKELRPTEWLHRGELQEREMTGYVAHLSPGIALRALKEAERLTSWPEECFHSRELRNSRCPGTFVHARLAFENTEESFVAVGARGVRAEEVAESAILDTRALLQCDAFLSRHTTTQLLLPLLLVGGDARVCPPSPESFTTLELIHRFRAGQATLQPEENGRTWKMRVRPA